MPKARRKRQPAKHWAKFRFEIIEARKGFYWRAVACNGRTVCHSEIYSMEHGARKTVHSLFRAIRLGEVKVCKELLDA